MTWAKLTETALLKGRRQQPIIVADPGFSRGGCTNSKKCYYFQIWLKPHENERIWTTRGHVPGAPLDPPMYYLANFTGKLHENVTGWISRLLSYQKKHMVEDDVLFYKSSGRKIGNPSGGHGVLPFRMGRTWFKLAVTSSNQFLPVAVHDKWTV